MWRDRQRPSRQVEALAEARIRDLDRKAQALLAMKATLEHLASRCRGDERPECPILESLSNGSAQLQVPNAPPTTPLRSKVAARQRAP